MWPFWAEVWVSWVDLQQQSPRLCTRSPCTLPQVSTGPSQESLPAARSLLLCFFNVAAWWSSRTAETSHISVPESSSAFCWVYSVNCSRNPQPNFVGAQTSCVWANFGLWYVRPVISASLNSCERAESSHLAGPIPVQRSGKIKNQQPFEPFESNWYMYSESETRPMRHCPFDLKMVGSTWLVQLGWHIQVTLW